METIRGRKSRALDFIELADRLTNYNRILLDLGTGDGRYVRSLAGKHPDWFIIGVDACRENLREHSQAKLQNALFVIASAQNLPHELNGFASHITINFPWGSLIDSLLKADAKLITGLSCVSRPGAQIDVRLNSGALAEAGTDLATGTEQIRANLAQAGWDIDLPIRMDAAALREFPTTWAKRLAYGRDPRAFLLSGCLK